MMHLQEHLRKTSNISKSMWTFTYPICTKLHAGIPRSHAWTWYIRFSRTLILRWWHWEVSAGQILLPSGNNIMNKCTICRSQWSPWRHPSTYPTTMPTPGISWRTWWRSPPNSGWNPTRFTRQRYYGRHINTWSYLYVSCMAKRA